MTLPVLEPVQFSRARPIDLGRILKINKPASRVLYELDELDKSVLPDAIAKAVSQ